MAVMSTLENADIMSAFAALNPSVSHTNIEMWRDRLHRGVASGSFIDLERMVQESTTRVRIEVLPQQASAQREMAHKFWAHACAQNFNL